LWKRRQFQKSEGWQGWVQGPALHSLVLPFLPPAREATPAPRRAGPGGFMGWGWLQNTCAQRLMFARRPNQDPPTNHHGESDGAAPAGACFRSTSAQPLSSPPSAGDVTERRFASAVSSIFFT